MTYKTFLDIVNIHRPKRIKRGQRHWFCSEPITIKKSKGKLIYEEDDFIYLDVDIGPEEYVGLSNLKINEHWAINEVFVMYNDGRNN